MISTEVNDMKLYSKEQTAKRRRAVQLWNVVLPVFCALCLAFCLHVILHVRTGNASASFWACLIPFTLAGWTVILARSLRVLPLKRLAAHEESILVSAENAGKYEGVLTRTGTWFSLPSSITLVKYALTAEDGTTVNLSAEKSRVKLLPADGTRVKVSAVRGFITEVTHEA